MTVDSNKRKNDDQTQEVTTNLTKRPRTEIVVATSASDKDAKKNDSTALTVLNKKVARTSELKAPTMKLQGHQGAIHTIKFSPNGKAVATGSFDKNIFLWNVYGDCDNYSVLSGHKNCVLELHWSNDNERLFSCSADKSIAYWDSESGERIMKLTGHESFVNSCCPSYSSSEPYLIVSASDDGTAKIWDTREYQATQTFPHNYQVTSASFSMDNNLVFTGSLDNIVRAWDTRKEEVVFEMAGHTDTITALALNPHDGKTILSYAMDGSLRVWNVQPFCAGGDANRCNKVLLGGRQNFEKCLLKCQWSKDASHVTAGSADNTVCIWKVETGEMVYKLPGHTGTVYDAAFHPSEPIIGSCSADKTVYLGEIAKF